MKKYLLFAFSVCLLSACSSESIGTDIPKEEDSPVAITLSAKSLSVDVETKGPYTETTPGAVADGKALIARVITSKTSKDYSTIYSDGTMTFTSNAKFKYDDDATNPYYPANDALLYFSGLYPATGWTVASSNSTASFTFTGKEDVMYAGEPSSKKTTAETQTPALEFNHLLTLLKVLVKAESADAVAAWGEITGISLAGNTVATVTLGTGVTAFSSSGDILFYGTGTDTAISDGNRITLATGNAVLSAYTMGEAVMATNTAPEYTLTVYSTTYTAGRAVNINLKNKETTPTDFIGTTKGGSFEITLTFKTSEIVATASVTAWEDSGTAEEEVQ